MRAKIDQGLFAQLHLDGHLSTELFDLLPHLLSMQSLIPQESGQLDLETAKDLLTYIWYNARTLKSKESLAASRVEHCARHTLTIIYYASLWRNVVDGAGWLVGSMQSSVIPGDIAWLIEDHPELLLWCCMTGGHFAKDFSRDWWIDLLVSVRHTMGITSFAAARKVVEDKLIWTQWLDQRAECFWNETSSIMKQLQLPWEKGV
ncbi:MAG: hypothetical protein Q9162_004399 [Coniocarpon cinnabarinum]